MIGKKLVVLFALAVSFCVGGKNTDGFLNARNYYISNQTYVNAKKLGYSDEQIANLDQNQIDKISRSSLVAIKSLKDLKGYSETIEYPNAIEKHFRDYRRVKGYYKGQLDVNVIIAHDREITRYYQVTMDIKFTYPANKKFDNRKVDFLTLKLPTVDIATPKEFNKKGVAEWPFYGTYEYGDVFIPNEGGTQTTIVDLEYGCEKDTDQHIRFDDKKKMLTIDAPMVNDSSYFKWDGYYYHYIYDNFMRITASFMIHQRTKVLEFSVEYARLTADNQGYEFKYLVQNENPPYLTYKSDKWSWFGITTKVGEYYRKTFSVDVDDTKPAEEKKR